MCKRLSLYAVLIVGMLVAGGALFAEEIGDQANAHIEYISPRPGAQLISPGTTIAIRPVEPVAAETVQGDLFHVEGERSGPHRGAARLADDQKTVIFVPEQPFAPSENVRVLIRRGLKTVSGATMAEVAFSFTTSPRQSLPVREANDLEEWGDLPTEDTPVKEAALQDLASLPDDFPPITVAVPPNGTGDGYVFLSPNRSFRAPYYLLILDNNGEAVYYQRSSSNIMDFKKQIDGTITYWMSGTFYALDNSYNLVNTYQPGNGYGWADGHDLQILPNGHALLMIYDAQPVDMSQIVPGGSPTATVIGLVLQELDTQKNVVFEWRSWDHFLITDTVVDLTRRNIDYVHGNAIELDTDGNWLISSRNLWEITKISRASGDIIWRLGGKNNQFTFINNDPPYFAYQHDIRRLPNGHVTLFDNRSGLTPEYSRAVEFVLDEHAKTATLVWEYRHPEDAYGNVMGNAQRLSNGNTVIGWGSGGRATEVRPDGSRALEFSFAPSVSYRAFRFPWHGYPMTQPSLSIEISPEATTLIYSWNGATDIREYRIYADAHPHPTTLIATQTKTGFETRTRLPKNTLGCRYYRVMPVDNNGWETRFSNEVTDCRCIYLPMMGK